MSANTRFKNTAYRQNLQTKPSKQKTVNSTTPSGLRLEKQTADTKLRPDTAQIF